MRKFLKRTLSGVGMAAAALFGAAYIWTYVESGVKSTHSSLVIHEEQIFGSRTYTHGKQFKGNSLRLEYGCLGKPTAILHDEDTDGLVERIRFLGPECRLTDFKEQSFYRSDTHKELFLEADELYTRHRKEMGVERLLEADSQKKEIVVDPKKWL